MSKQNFDKFINKKVKGAKKKEQIKQEKKSVKKEREAYFIEKKREMRAAKKLQNGAQEFAKKSGGSSKSTSAPKKWEKKTGSSSSADASYRSRDKGLNKTKSNSHTRPDISPKKPLKEQAPKPEASERPAKKQDLPAKSREDSKQKYQGKKILPREKTIGKERPKQEVSANTPRPKKTFDAGLPYERKPITKAGFSPNDKTGKTAKPVRPLVKKEERDDGNMPLNKYIAHGGICSRRDAGELVKSGKVKVNGEVVTNPGYKVQEKDTVLANGKLVTPQLNLVYILLNKPKDFITTADDPQGRKTVLDIVKGATNERIYPVGRLDRNTSGVLLLTNDGELAQHLTHPSFEVRKIYEAKLDKPLAKADFDKLLNGVDLEDGEVHADSVAYADSKDKSIIGIEIHSGRNRVVRRMFEHLGYDVKGLDRVMFANLTKKNVDRGKWRFLNEKEVRLLKFFNKSKR